MANLTKEPGPNVLAMMRGGERFTTVGLVPDEGNARWAASDRDDVVIFLDPSHDLKVGLARAYLGEDGALMLDVELSSLVTQKLRDEILSWHAAGTLRVGVHGKAELDEHGAATKIDLKAVTFGDGAL